MNNKIQKSGNKSSRKLEVARNTQGKKKSSTIFTKN